MKWKTVPVGWLADVRPSSVDKKASADETPVRLCNYTDVYYADTIIGDRQFMEASATPDEIRRFGLRRDDIAITKDSETADDIGVPAWVREDLPGVLLGYHTSLLRPRQIDGRFLFWALMADTTKAYYEQSARGVTRFALRQQDVAATPVPVPPPEVQQRIANYLDTETARIDTLIAKCEHAAALVEERFVRLRFDLLSGRTADEPRRSMYSPWFDSRPASWSDVKLGTVLRLQRGYDLPAVNREAGDVPVVSSGGIIGRHSRAAEGPPGIVTGRYGTIGEVYFVNEPYWPLNTSLFVKHRWGVTAEFAYWLLQTVPLAFDSDKSAVGGINRNVVHDVRVPLPALQVQRSIVNELVRAAGTRSKLLKSVDLQRDLLRERRQALITSAVTGELEV